MSTHIYLAPAAAGKTAYILTQARAASRDLAATPRIVVPTYLQARAARRRLAEMGGAIGVRVLTFDRLYAEVLDAAREIYVELSESVQYRLLRSVVEGLPLTHYAPLVDRPGFIQVLQRLIGEFKAARVLPDALTSAVQAMGDERRLTELAQIYTAYQVQLQAQGYADRAGLGWLAVEALEQRAPKVGQDWPLLAVDGFDSFTSVQIALLRVLAGRVQELVVCLTGEMCSHQRPLVHRRFADTRANLEEALSVHAELLPGVSSLQPSVDSLGYLTANLFRPEAKQVTAEGSVEWIEPPDRAAEVRAALRWLKARMVLNGMRPREVALLARAIRPYRGHILQVAAEFGLPIQLADDLPLQQNCAVTALLDLLRAVLPGPDGQPSLPVRLVLEAWRSPYFDWSALPSEDAPEPIGIEPGDADALGAVARWGCVIGGWLQWEETLTRLAARSAERRENDDDERGVPPGVPISTEARTLLDKMRRFVDRVMPPARGTMRDYVGWLELLIGEDPAHDTRWHPVAEEPTSLHVIQRTRNGQLVSRIAGTEPAYDARRQIADLDLAALAGLKEVLRGLVWAEEAVAPSMAINYSTFYAELTGAVAAATYRPPTTDREAVLVADAIQARGLPFRAVALLGLAEGEFPAGLTEDPFLRETDRQRLRTEFGLPLVSSITSAEAEFFYEAVARPKERLLLSRPRLADDGAKWQASPFWEETLRLLGPRPPGAENAPDVGQIASWPELMEHLAVGGRDSALSAWAAAQRPERLDALKTAVRVLTARENRGQTLFSGDLTVLAELTAARFGPDHVWSASRLETYRSCPFHFFIANVLGLEPRPEAAEGLDARQFGTICHRILEQVFRGVDNPSNLEVLLAALPTVAERVLDEAPAREGFRATAWWDQTRLEITENIRRSLIELAALSGDFRPLHFEERFWDDSELCVTVPSGGTFRLHGVIDRIDRAPDGRLRVIDYKTGGPSSYSARAVSEGKKLQLPLYALAAQAALRLGAVVDGFYWHVGHAERSEFTLAGGAESAMATAAEYAWAAVAGIRAGQFHPNPPADGCPDYCPAAAFCWSYREAFHS